MSIISIVPPTLTVLQDQQVTTNELSWYIQRVIAIAMISIVSGMVMRTMVSTARRVKQYDYD